eukprot:CAMPEP_0117684170 /NCGR_PEP_ID=MMETSP0804-20121206/20912_1 /TAXON_ID=1074897 /ORGANISM="Tetraselmis astigmatica, Strain CCMP880" /LENGTH=538 /DNA_ID=CAMNT_0005495055 /DNA_START=124 /DNA_END=1736 /DNA_ORIENTATION=+
MRQQQGTAANPSSPPRIGVTAQQQHIALGKAEAKPSGKGRKPAVPSGDWLSVVAGYNQSRSAREALLAKHGDLLGEALLALQWHGPFYKIDLQTKLALLVFLEENALDGLLGTRSPESLMAELVVIVQGILKPSGDDHSRVAPALKRQAVATASSLFIVLEAVHDNAAAFEEFVQLLVDVVAAPEEPHLHAAAAESLRIMESHCPGLLAQICGVTLDLWRRSSLTAVGQPYALLTATILGNIAESDVQVVDIDGDPQTAGSSSQGRSLSDILSVPSKPPAFHIPKEYLPPEVYGLSAPTAPAYTASRSDLQALQEAALQLLGSLLFLTSVGRTQLMMALRPLLLRVKLTAVQAGPQLSLLLHSCDPLQSQLMVHMSHEVRGIIDVQEYSALLLRLASIANDSSHPLHVRQLSLLWFSSACERVERQKMGSVGGGQAVLPGVEALGWNWHVLLPGPMDEPQMVVMKTRTLVRILTAGVGDPEDVVTAIRELPGLWLSSPACATASAAIAAVLMLQRAHNLPEAMHLQLCSELGTLLLQV